jgi:predicted phosphoribosyltransferase
VALEVARALHAPLDIFVVRKLGVPGHEELALGAIASGGVMVLNRDIVRDLELSENAIDAVVDKERVELMRREGAYRGGRTPVTLQNRRCILVDDGLATGASMRAAVEALRARGPVEIVVAVPIAPPETCEALSELADVVVCARTPEPFFAVGRWYVRFDQIEDEEVTALLERAWREEAREEAAGLH